MKKIMYEIERYPAHIRELHNEIENLAGNSIDWIYDGQLEGAMSASIEKGKPVIRYRQVCESGIAEELLHLKLDLAGYPRLSCPENMHLVRQTITMLHNTIQHHIIYSYLEAWGYHPRCLECYAIRKQINVLEKLDVSRLRNEKYLQPLCAMVYARTALDCNDTGLQNSLEGLFSDSGFNGARKIGRNLVNVIEQIKSESKGAYIVALEHCLAHLGLEDIVAVEN